MIKGENQKIKNRRTLGHQENDALPANATRTRRNSSHKSFQSARRGISQHVMNVAEQMMKEYRADLEYLKDR